MSQNTSVTVNNSSSNNLSLYERLTKKYNHLVSDNPISENELILNDRLTKIRSVIQTYGEENFYISFSGGKDSTVLSALVDMAIPNNKIPRVYANTGIELNMVRDFVFDIAKTDKRFQIIVPSTPIKPMLERDGYPFKSKNHARILNRYQEKGMMDSVKSYLGGGKWGKKLQCPKSLQYQFTPQFNLKVSDKCCFNLKEKPLDNWAKEHGKKYAMIGVMRDEHGRREQAVCLAFKGNQLKYFQPMVPLTKEWEEWFIKEYNIEICAIYKPPYNFSRSGCKACPMSIHIDEELEALRTHFPEEYRQALLIFGPVYDEYKRIGYRLKEEVTNDRAA